MMDIKARVIKFICEKSKYPKIAEMSDEKLLMVNYLDIGILDSLQIVEMIITFEKDFNIRFTPEVLQSEKFRSTLNGAIEVIKSLRGDKP